MPRLDLTGEKFGRLVVEEYAGYSTTGHSTKWKCRCGCGRDMLVQGSNLRSGHTKSCGCLSAEMTSKRFTGNKHNLTHGYRPRGKRTPAYGSWANMIQRTTNPNVSNYLKYGGAGVTVCERWLTFENFLADLGSRPSQTSLGRILDMGNYEPGNAFWMTMPEQMLCRRNKRALSSIGVAA